MSLAGKVNDAATYRAVVPVTYAGDRHALNCYIVDEVALDCAHDGVIWVQYNYESSAESGGPVITPANGA